MFSSNFLFIYTQCLAQNTLRKHLFIVEVPFQGAGKLVIFPLFGD